jgi:hypothetical protein
MKRKIFVTTFCTLALAVLIFYACKKGNQEPTTLSNQQFRITVESWLGKQKHPDFPNKANNIESLKENLDYSNLKTEDFTSEKKFLVIPIKEKFKALHNIDGKDVIVLLLTVDLSGDVIQGKIVRYLPAKNNSQIPSNTFSRIFKGETLLVSGIFKFLSVSGSWLYQLGYKNGKLESYGVVRKKKEGITPVAQGKTDDIRCRDWYLETVYYYSDGTTITTTEWLFRTCSQDCGGGDYQAFCPPDEGGATSGSFGGNNNPPPPPPDCCITDPDIQYTVTAVSQVISEQCGTESVDPLTGLLTRNCLHKWKFSRQSLLIWNWSDISQENYITQKESGVWKFKDAKSITHGGIYKEGQEPPCFTTKVSVDTFLASLEPDRTMAHVDMSFSITGTFSCKYPLSNPPTQYSSATTSWNA